MRIAAVILLASSVALSAQDIQLKEHPNLSAKASLYEAVSADDADGILAIRAADQYRWNITPIINQTWDGSKKELALVVEVVGEKLQPSTVVFVVDSKTFAMQSADWGPDSRGNLAALFFKEGLVRNIAGAQDVSITVFAPLPLTADFKSSDLSVFRSMVQAYDSNSMHSAPAPEKTNATALTRVPWRPDIAPIGAKPDGKESVTVITHESSTTPYYWEKDGRVSVSCSGDSCSGYYTLPAGGVQQIGGAILKLRRADSSIVVAQCVSKVNVLASTMEALDAINANDPNAPTVYRNCRIPPEDFKVEADFHKNTVKILWRVDNSNVSETYSILGVLQPAPIE